MLDSTHWYRMANAEDAMYSQGLPQGVATNIMLFMLNLKYLEVNFHGLKVHPPAEKSPNGKTWKES